MADVTDDVWAGTVDHIQLRGLLDGPSFALTVVPALPLTVWLEPLWVRSLAAVEAWGGVRGGEFLRVGSEEVCVAKQVHTLTSSPCLLSGETACVRWQVRYARNQGANVSEWYIVGVAWLPWVEAWYVLRQACVAMGAAWVASAGASMWVTRTMLSEVVRIATQYVLWVESRLV